MLQSMRDNLKGTIAIIMVGFLSFILIGSLLQFSGNSNQNRNEVASIDSRTITELDLLRAIEGRRQQLTAQLGDQLPPEFLSNERLRPLALDTLINYSLLINTGLDGLMTVSDQSLNERIVTLPQFQIEGKYSPEQFRAWLSSMLYTVPSFKKVLKEDIIASQIQRSLMDSGFVTDAEWNTSISLALQTRGFTWVTLPLESLQQKISLTKEEIQTFYDENKATYLSDEQVAVEYLELTVDDIAAAITIDDEALRQQYEQEIASYKEKTEREVAHI
jgi:peptidyl-prolyl cis-trans isomerase D